MIQLRFDPRVVAICLAILSLASTRALALDGTAALPGDGECTGTCPRAPTYYEGLATQGSLAALETPDAALPTTLALDDSTATVRYALETSDAGRSTWEVRISGLARNHERVDAVYHVLLAIPLPANANGSAAFKPLDRGITPREGDEDASVPLIYGGEKVVLKRDIALEKALLPGLVGDPASGRLPSLAGTGYSYTLWGAIVQHDPSHDSIFQGWAALRYETSLGTEAPNADDERMKAYVFTWVPKLRSDVPTWAIRMDVAP